VLKIFKSNERSKMKHILVLALVCLSVLASTGCQVVTGYNHTLGPGETLSGDLVVLGGDSILSQGSRITGSLVMMGGTVQADGTIDGDVSLSGGDVTFGPTAVVAGWMHRTGGGIHVAQGASVPSVSYSQSLATGATGRAAASLLILLVMLPLAYTIIAVILLAIWSGRAIAAAVAEGQNSVVSMSASNQATIRKES
jgi:hypothetical protein